MEEHIIKQVKYQSETSSKVLGEGSVIPSRKKKITEEFRSNSELISRLERLKDNPVAKIISSLSKQNEVFKKCLNQIIKNEENFTKHNHEIYFDDNVISRL